MSSIQAQTTASPASIGTGPYASLDALTQSHAELQKSSYRRQKPAEAADRLRAFIARARATGAVLSAATDRRAAQGILDYWCTELVSLPGANAYDFGPVLLAPFAGAQAATQESLPSASTESVSAPSGEPGDLKATAQETLPSVSAKPVDAPSGELGRVRAAAAAGPAVATKSLDPPSREPGGMRAAAEEVGPAAATRSMDNQSRELVRLAAAARLWRDSGRQFGYLLLDRVTIAKAARFRHLDPDIGELVSVSEAEATKQRYLRIAGAVVILLIFLIFVGTVTGLLWFKYEALKRDKEYSGLLATQTAVQLDKAQRASADLQKRVDTLERLLRERNIPIPGDTAATETVRPAVAEAIRVDRIKPNGSGPPYQDGYIWIGSDTPGTNNLVDLNTGAPVMPADVVAGQSYRVVKNLVFRQGKPSPTDYSSTQSLGVAPEGTQVTALAAPPEAYQRPSGEQYWLEVRVTPSQTPIVYVQYATATGVVASQIAAALREHGFQVPGVEETQLAKNVNEVRYFYSDDKNAANKLARDVTETLRSLKYPNMPAVKVVDLTESRGKRNYPGVIELWLDLPEIAKK
jgi:hypothetical protein